MKANTIDIFDVVQDAIAANHDAGSYYIANATLEAIRSAGYVVVPVEPTEEMCEAGGPETAWASADNMRVGAQSVYSAMIAAAGKE